MRDEREGREDDNMQGRLVRTGWWVAVEKALEERGRRGVVRGGGWVEVEREGAGRGMTGRGGRMTTCGKGWCGRVGGSREGAGREGKARGRRRHGGWQ